MAFPGHVHQLLYPEVGPITWFDLVDAAGWNDRPKDAVTRQPL